MGKSEYIQNRINKIYKIPKHLTIILGNDEINIKTVAKLIIWCIRTKVTFVSFHDSTGMYLL